MRETGLQAQARGGVSRHVAEEFGQAVVVEAVERPAERVIVEMLRENALSDEALGGRCAHVSMLLNLLAFRLILF